MLHTWHPSRKLHFSNILTRSCGVRGKRCEKSQALQGKLWAVQPQDFQLPWATVTHRFQHRWITGTAVWNLWSQRVSPLFIKVVGDLATETFQFSNLEVWWDAWKASVELKLIDSGFQMSSVMMGHANTKTSSKQEKCLSFLQNSSSNHGQTRLRWTKKMLYSLTHLFLDSYNMSFFIYSGCFVFPPMHFPRCARNHTATDPTDSAGAFSQIEAGL